MHLLLDECVPKRLRQELAGHDVSTVREAGWAGLKNGALLRAANNTFDALITVDQGIAYQQNLAGLRISLIIISAASNDIDDLRPLMHDVRVALATLETGVVIRVGR